MKVHNWNQMRMEHDATDSTDAEVMNGDIKPDPTKLSHTGIIKQDVMLSATSTQSPLATASSVFTMPSVAMAASAGQTTIANLHDNLFMTVPSVNDATLISHVNDLKNDAVAHSGLSALSSPAAHQLFGQPQVATPQFFLASQPGLPAAQPVATAAALAGPTAASVAAASAGTTTSIPVQQLLIPVSTANGSQQFISIPVSLATGGNQQIQLLTTSNGQLIATNLASIQGLATPINMSLPQIAGSPVSSSSSSQSHTTTQHNAATVAQTLQPQVAHQSNHVQSSNSAAAAAATAAQNLSTAISANQIAGLPSLLTGSVGQTSQLMTVSPQVLAQAVSSVSQGVQSNTSNNNSNSNNTSVSSTTNHLNTTNHSLAHQHQSNSAQQQQQQLTMSPQPAHRHTTSNQQVASAVTVTQAGSTTSNHAPSSAAAAAAAALQQQLSQVIQAQGLNASAVITAMSHPTVRAATIAPQVVTTTDGLSAAVSQLLPNTVSNSTESTTVDGINLDEIKEFAKQFKIRRLSLGLTQTQVGQALSATEGPAYSQSAICRFEKLDITPKSAQKIKPVLERWMREAEDRYKNGVQNLSDFIGSEPSKKKKVPTATLR